MAQLAQITSILDGDGAESGKTSRINHIPGNDGPCMEHMTMLLPMKGHSGSQLEMAVSTI